MKDKQQVISGLRHQANFVAIFVIYCLTLQHQWAGFFKISKGGLLKPKKQLIFFFFFSKGGLNALLARVT